MSNKKNKGNNLVLMCDLSFSLLFVAIYIMVITLTGGRELSQLAFIMLNLTFLVIILSYFFGLVTSLIIPMLMIFAISSILLYNYIFNGIQIETDLYYWSIFMFMSSALAGTVRNSIENIQNENLMYRKAVEEISTIDKDSGLYNVKALNNDLTIFMNIARRHDLKLALMLIRPKYIVDLKRIIGNDKFQLFLNELTKLVRKVLRYEDRFYLLGSDYTFASIMVTDTQGMKVVIDKVKSTIYTNTFEHIVPLTRINVELGIGYAIYDKDNITSPQHFIDCAWKELDFDVDSFANILNKSAAVISK